MKNLITLEDLRNFLSNKLKNESKSFDFSKQLEEIDKIIKEYDLSNDESEYVEGCESASHQKTMINTTKAQEILLKRKK